jgi:hypothetical protein
MDEQRYVINGINNDKIEFKSNYDIRKFNNLMDAKRAEIMALVKSDSTNIWDEEHDRVFTQVIELDKLENILNIVFGN